MSFTVKHGYNILHLLISIKYILTVSLSVCSQNLVELFQMSNSQDPRCHVNAKKQDPKWEKLHCFVKRQNHEFVILLFKVLRERAL